MKNNAFSLSQDELFHLDNIIDESNTKLNRNSIILSVILLVLSIIPIGFLPRRRGSIHLSDEEKSLNMIQSLGFGWWLVAVIIILALAYFLMRLDKKIVPLKKDREEQEGLELNVIVTRKVYESSPIDYYCMFVSNQTVANLKVVLDEHQYSLFREGQQTTIRIFKNSKLLIPVVAYTA